MTLRPEIPASSTSPRSIRRGEFHPPGRSRTALESAKLELSISAQRRKGFKRLFFSQVFFGRIKTTGRVRELFARDFPNVYQAINDLKRKDYRQLAYLLQAHESKIMIDVICRRILEEVPGTFIATIHDSIMTTPDKADEVKAIMVREFQRFGLNPKIRLEAY